MENKIGFIQGRLSPIIDGKIQAFPWEHWKEEFPLAQQSGLRLLEWTLDDDRLYQNPLLVADGQKEIRALCNKYEVSIPSLTGDCFMQAPFWKASPDKVDTLKRDFISIAEACSLVGIEMIVVPLVDNGRLDNQEQEDELIRFLEEQSKFFESKKLKVIFESDFTAKELARFIDRLSPSLFGINYDIGNSVALGYDSKEEFAAYGKRIVNVHVKDRLLGDTTVALGTGNADFDTVFSELAQINYDGNFILQTARATDENHASTLCAYRDMVVDWMNKDAIGK